jgi:hypothetical protein
MLQSTHTVIPAPIPALIPALVGRSHEQWLIPLQKRRLDPEDGGAKNFNAPEKERFRPTEPREWTISIAVPTSLITK